jgi:hypothetical protein
LDSDRPKKFCIIREPVAAVRPEILLINPTTPVLGDTLRKCFPSASFKVILPGELQGKGKKFQFPCEFFYTNYGKDHQDNLNRLVKLRNHSKARLTVFEITPNLSDNAISHFLEIMGTIGSEFWMIITRSKSHVSFAERFAPRKSLEQNLRDTPFSLRTNVQQRTKGGIKYLSNLPLPDTRGCTASELLTLAWGVCVAVDILKLNQ